MINKRLLQLLNQSVKYVGLTVLLNCLGSVMNIIFIMVFVYIISLAASSQLTAEIIILGSLVMGAALMIKALCQKRSTEVSYYAASEVKQTLHDKILDQINHLGIRYQQYFSSAELTQLATEGTEQLEIYFSRYLPQLFTSMIIPVVLFMLLSWVSLKSALVLLICVPLIPISILAVQKFAKKLLSKYWGAYTNLADRFLENLQGLTTLKIYQADERRAKKMYEEAETFRRITMKVLTMQLNSIIVMDLVAYGGAALGIVVAILDYKVGAVSLAGSLFIALLAAEFFIPLRLLGSYFHIAMNGMAASDKIFRLLDIECTSKENKPIDGFNMQLKHLFFQYDENRCILKDISMSIEEGQFIGITGQSGSGKSTLAKILQGSLISDEKSMMLGNQYVDRHTNLTDYVTLVGHNNHLFKGTVQYNLLMAKPNATTDELWKALEQVKLKEFVESNGGLLMELKEGASNLSGGQRQRLNLARAILRDTPIYIFDEATSNIDVESENAILDVIYSLKGLKTIIMISHRLDYCESCDCLYFLEMGKITEQGTFSALMDLKGKVADLVYQQRQWLKKADNL